MNVDLIKQLAKGVIEVDDYFGYTSSNREVSQQVWQIAPQPLRTQIICDIELKKGATLATNYNVVLDHITSVWA
jgi:hypothetical protein